MNDAKSGTRTDETIRNIAGRNVTRMPRQKDFGENTSRGKPMKNKTDFYENLHRQKTRDPIVEGLWEIRKLVTITHDAGDDLWNQINGALRIRFEELKKVEDKNEDHIVTS